MCYLSMSHLKDYDTNSYFSKAIIDKISHVVAIFMSRCYTKKITTTKTFPIGETIRCGKSYL